MDMNSVSHICEVLVITPLSRSLFISPAMMRSSPFENVICGTADGHDVLSNSMK